MKTLIVWIMMLSLFILVNCVDKPTSSNRGSVSGTVVNDSGKSPLAGVTISIQNVGTKITDLNGYYSFNDLESGTYTITASKSGYVTEQSTVIIESNLHKTVDFSMHTAQPAHLVLNIASINFGLAETQIQMLVNNSGDNVLTWQASSNQPWLTAIPLTGTTTTETDEITVFADRLGLGIGQYSANLSVTSNGGSVIIPVSIEVGQFVSAPIIVPNGGVYNAPQNISISCSTVGAQIRYTMDGSEPTQSSALYSTTINVATSVIVKAKAYKSGWSPSPTTTANFVIDQTVSTPTFNPPAGSYSSTQLVSILCLTNGAQIRYTINGSEPNDESTQYTEPINVTTSTTIKAKAYKSGWTPSLTSTALYSINIMQTVSDPTIYPNGGTYGTAQTVYMSCTTTGADIRYTNNDSDPTENSLLYTGPFNISATSTIKAKAYKSGWNPSSIISESYYFPTGYYEDFEGTNTWSMLQWHNTSYPPGNWEGHGSNWVEWDNWYSSSFPNSIMKTVYVQDCNKISFDLKRFYYAGVSLYINNNLIGSATTNGTHVFSLPCNGYITIKFIGIGDYVGVGDTSHLDNIRVYYE